MKSKTPPPNGTRTKPKTAKGRAPSTKLDGPTRAKQVAFLTAYAELGNVTHAAFTAQVDRSSHYWWMEHDPRYPKAFEEAEAISCDNVRQRIRQWAMEGWEEPVVYQGAIQYHRDAEGNPVKPVTVRKRSDRLIELMAKAKCPEFRDKHEHEHKGTVTLEAILAASHVD